MDKDIVEPDVGAAAKAAARAAADGRPELLHPCGAAPGPGEAREIAPGVRWLRMPMPFKPAHINLWAIEEENGWTVVDTGLRDAPTIAAWQALLDGPLAAPAGGPALTRVLVTHMHPDHSGMAGWLAETCACPLWMTRSEYLGCRAMTDIGAEATPSSIAFYLRAGWNADAVARHHAVHVAIGKLVHPLPEHYRRMVNGELFFIGRHAWQVVVGEGHTPEHACLYCPELKLLIAGDQVLPRISSNVSVHADDPGANPLAHWLASIARLKRLLPDDVLVLPAHDEPFIGLHARLDYLEASALRGLDRLREALREPRRAVDVFGALYAQTITADNPVLLGLATGESLAHLNYLLCEGDAVVREDEQGVAWYSLV
ncbi:MAG: MBL fold metallo-hydrolase [Pseudomonadota bacterium]